MVIGSVTALVTSLAGFWRSGEAGEEKKAEAAYETVKSAIKDLQAEVTSLHEDVTSQRAYMEGLRVGWIANPQAGGFGEGAASSPTRGIRTAAIPAPPAPPQVRQSSKRRVKLPEFDEFVK